ncbi:MAG TPA: hypothetical protein VK133_04200 [Amoebophilaceae bacterium]|jgi:hypothetical protein|nr:hypothetical protein [Amoebophilaceae bacterium]
MVLSTFGVLGCTRVTPASIQCSSETQITLQSSEFLGSISCLEGTQTSFLVRCTGWVSNPKGTGAVGVIGIPADAALEAVLEHARKVNSKRGEPLWRDGCFVFWQKGNAHRGTNGIAFPVEEFDRQRLTTRDYTLYMVYTEGTNIIHDPTGLKLTIPQRDKLLDYKALQLRATGYGIKQVEHGVEWLLKGSVAKQATLPVDPNAFGFLLARGTREGGDPCKLMEKIVGSGEPWPTKSALLNDCLIVPGSVRKVDHALEGHLSSNNLALKEGTFSLFCYVKQGANWYISQMEHVLPCTADGRLSPQPPTLALQETGYKVAPLQPEVCCTSLSGRIQSVQWINHTPASALPADIQPCILFLRKGTLWRTAKLETLFAQLRTSNDNVYVNNEHTLCLTTDESKTLDPPCYTFFNDSHDFKCFRCLFSKKEGKLKYYTEKQSIEPRHIEQNPPPSEQKEEAGTRTVNPSPEQNPSPEEKPLPITPTPDPVPASVPQSEEKEVKEEPPSSEVPKPWWRLF